MTETFTASDGVTLVQEQRGGQLGVGRGGQSWAGISSEFVPALREFSLHEAGIWVDPETGAHVYRRAHEDDRDGRCVLVVTPDDSIRVWEKLSAAGDGPSAIAARYFAAHPVQKAWHDAKPGEVWLLALDSGEPTPACVFDFDGIPHFSVPGREDFSATFGRITDGRKIWPEVVSDA